MSTSATPSNPNRPGDERNLVPVDPSTAVGFEDKLDLFWKKYRTMVIGICVLCLAAIVGKGGWEYFERQAELKIESQYAAATNNDQLKAFIAAQPNHSLAGVAHVRLADEAYAAGKSADAIAGYEKAASILKATPLGARAQLGLALAKIQSGKEADGINDLKNIAGEANQFKAVRTEASYHLASLAAAAGNSAEVQKYTDQLMQVDPSSPWTQRGLSLRASLPAQPAEAAPAPADASQKKDAGAKKDDAAKKDEGSKKIEVKLPGK